MAVVKGKKIAILAKFDFGDSVWYKAATKDGDYREGVVTALFVSPSLDILYQVTWGDGTITENYEMELLSEKPAQWENKHD